MIAALIEARRARLVLGSSSPRRRELLAQIGLEPAQVIGADIDETPHKGEVPHLYCARMAREKALALDIGPRDLLLCADTTVAVGRRILGKPGDRDEARRFLVLLGGRRHRVITSVALRTRAHLRERTVVSKVRLAPLPEAVIEAYLDSGDWRGKAGGYGIQGPASTFIPWIEGSYSAIVGLPLAQTASLLRAGLADLP